MTGIRPAIDDYLSVRRSLGYKLEDREWRWLTSSVSWRSRAPPPSPPSWRWIGPRCPKTCSRRGGQPACESCRLRAPSQGVRSCHRGPTGRPAGWPNRRAVPYLYSKADVCALMAATALLRPTLHAATHRVLIGLLSVTGMRLGEVIRLDRSDLDTAEGV